jgi:hypothetical protein
MRVPHAAMHRKAICDFTTNIFPHASTQFPYSDNRDHADTP